MDFSRGQIPPTAREADALVERALFLAATGYWYTEVKRETGERSGDRVTRVRKQQPPNLTAIALWLTHRMPQQWGEGAVTGQENDLLLRLREALERGEEDGVSTLQPEAGPGHGLVAAAGDPTL